MGWICLIVLGISLALSFPIAMCLGIASLAGVLYTSSDLLVILPQRFLAGIDSFPLLAIPLFILAGQIMGQGGIARRIVDLAMVFVGRIRGGLGMVSILSTMLFSGISGSSSADTAAIGSITLPAMKKRAILQDLPLLWLQRLGEPPRWCHPPLILSLSASLPIYQSEVFLQPVSYRAL